MPRPRRFLFLSLTATVVGLAVGMWALWPRTAITRENAAKIREGMTLADVEAILGGPARDEASGPVALDEGAIIPDWMVRNTIELGHWWQSNEVTVTACVDAEQPEGRVTKLVVWPQHRVYESPLAMVRRWLGL